MKKLYKYLQVTIHDNDFYLSQRIMCEMLYYYFQKYCGYPTAGNLPALKKYIGAIWFGLNYVEDTIKYNIPPEDEGYSEVPQEYFEPKLAIVYDYEVPGVDNDQDTAYIPLFDGGEVIIA